MKLKFTLFVSIIIILIVYSSEISFLPNYKYRPDKWHLFIPMFGIYIALISQLIWSIIEKIKMKKDSVNIIMMAISVLLFSTLNNPKGNSENIGYFGLIILGIVSIILYFIENRNESKKINSVKT